MWVDGQPHGHGKKTLNDGTMYEGAWHEGRAKGNGVKVLPNGTMFEGDWDDHVFLKGKCQFSDG